MARKVKQVTIAAEGRDKGKVFVITEMPARAAEKFGQRMAAALLQAMSGSTAAHEAAMDEELSLVKIIGDPTRPDVPPRPLIEEDIEEVETLKELRREVAELHMGFYVVDALSKLISGTATSAGSSTTRTSQEFSER